MVFDQMAFFFNTQLAYSVQCGKCIVFFRGTSYFFVCIFFSHRLMLPSHWGDRSCINCVQLCQSTLLNLPRSQCITHWYPQHTSPFGLFGFACGHTLRYRMISPTILWCHRTLIRLNPGVPRGGVTSDQATQPKGERFRYSQVKPSCDPCSGICRFFFFEVVLF